MFSKFCNSLCFRKEISASNIKTPNLNQNQGRTVDETKEPPQKKSYELCRGTESRRAASLAVTESFSASYAILSLK